MPANKKTRALVATCLLTILILPLLAGCSLEELTGITAFIPEKQAGFYVGGEKIELELDRNSGGFYNDLTEDQKKIYTAAVAAIESGKNSFICAGIDYAYYLETYGDALTALLYDHPEYFWISGEAVASAEYIEGTNYGNVKVELSIYDYWWEANLFAAQEAFDKAVNDILNEASALDSDYEKVKLVHDMIIKNTAYDYESYEAGSNIDAESDAIVNTAYGALVANRAMCGGYSRAFGHIMHKLGIESFYVTGVADGGAHAWNIIKLDGEYYHVDLTWDDADGEPCEILYSYFCVADDDIFKTHTIHPEFGDMHATSTEYNYFVREGLFLEFYKFSEINEMAKRYEGDVLFTFKCADKYVFAEAVDKLIDEYRFYDLEGMADISSFSYAADEAQYILTFVLE